MLLAAQLPPPNAASGDTRFGADKGLSPFQYVSQRYADACFPRGHAMRLLLHFIAEPAQGSLAARALSPPATPGASSSDNPNDGGSASGDEAEAEQWAASAATLVGAAATRGAA